MKKNIVLFILLLFNFSCFAKNHNDMTSNITFSLSPCQKKNLLGSAVPLTMTIKNETGNTISVILPYPDPDNLSFDSPSWLIEKKVTEVGIGGRVIPTIINPGETYTSTYFLNRYFKFLQEGESDINYIFYTTITPDGLESENVFYKGILSVNIEKATEDGLRNQFAKYSNNLKSDNKKTKMEAVEALSFIDNPLCISYVIPMLSIENIEVNGINTLSHFNTEEAQNAIFNMLSHRESSVVTTAIESLKANKVSIPRPKFIEMLSSSNANIRLIGLENLESTPDVNDKDNINPLLEDINPIVADKANEYYLLLLSLTK